MGANRKFSPLMHFPPLLSPRYLPDLRWLYFLIPFLLQTEELVSLFLKGRLLTGWNCPHTKHTNSVDAWVLGAALNTPPRLFGLILTTLFEGNTHRFNLRTEKLGGKKCLCQVIQPEVQRSPNPRQPDPRVQALTLLWIPEGLGFVIAALLILILVFDYEAVSCTGNSLQAKPWHQRMLNRDCFRILSRPRPLPDAVRPPPAQRPKQDISLRHSVASWTFYFKRPPLSICLSCFCALSPHVCSVITFSRPLCRNLHSKA